MSQYGEYGNDGSGNSKANNSLRPVTVAQLVRAIQPHATDDSRWTIEGTEVGQVTLVANIVSMERHPRHTTIELDDGTGRAEALCWLHLFPEVETAKWIGIEENTYVRVIGSFQLFGYKRYINAVHVCPIRDPHEVYYHIVHVISTSVTLERSALPAPGQDNARRSGNGDTSAAYMTQSYSNTGGMEQYNQLPPLQKSIIKFIIHNKKGTEGMHIAAILRGLNTDQSEIDPAIEKLLDEGYIFTTLDDFHFDVPN